ncbi:MAG: MotA/TolQ/ExbB proton channel family protein [Acidobacteriota bacterium]
MRLLLVEHACARAATREHERLARGSALLATISATAPWLGLLLTTRGIVFSFQGYGGEKWTCFAATVQSLSEAQYPAAFGLATAIVAWCLQHWMRARVRDFDTEMRATTLELMNELRRIAL